jgi:hypothetical protein
VILGNDTTLTGVAITLSSMVDADLATSNRTLTVNGSGATTFGGAVGSGQTLLSVTTDGAGTTAINGGSVKTSGAQTYNDAVSLGTDTTLTDTTVSFGSTVTGNVHDLILVSSGGITLALGNITGLRNFTKNGGGNATVSGVLTTTANQTWTNAVILANDTTLAGVAITLSSTVDADLATSNRTLTVNGSGATVFGSAVGGTQALLSVTTNAGGTTAINGGSVKTSGAQTYNDPVSLGANTTVTSGPITFGSSLNGAHDLELVAGGAILVSGAVGGSTPLTSLIVTDSTGATFQGNVNAGTLTLTDTTGTIEVDGNLTVTTMMSAAGAGFSLALNQGPGAQTSTVAGAAPTQFANTGALSIGNAALDTITFSVGLQATTQSAITFQGTVATGGAVGQNVTLDRLAVGTNGLTMNLGLGNLDITAAPATMDVSVASATVSAALVNLGSLSVAIDSKAKFAASAVGGVTIAAVALDGPNQTDFVTGHPSDTIEANNGILDVGASNFLITSLDSTGILRLTGEQSGSHSVTNNVHAGIIEYYDGTAAGTVFDDIISAAPNYYHLRINGSARTFTVNGNIDVAADVILDGGIFALGSTTLTVGGYWINNGSSAALSSGTGTVKLVPNAARLSAPHVIKVYGDNTWWILWCESPGAVILFENDKFQRIASGGVFHIKGTAGSHIALSRLYKTIDGPVAGTEDPAALPDGSPYNPSEPPDNTIPKEDYKLLWKFDMIPGAVFAMDYVDVFYSDASTNPVSIPPNVYAAPYNDAVAPQVSHYCYKWLSYLFAMYSYTEDSDYNGKIDRIRVTTEAAVDNDFSGFVAEVQGYTVIGYSRPSLGNTFYILLQEKPYLDTGVIPDWHVVSNTSLFDDQYKSQKVWTLSRVGGSEWMTPGDTAWPILGHTLALPGLASGSPDTYMHFSEPVVTSSSGKPTDADLGLSGAPSYTVLAGSGNGVQTVLGRAPIPLTLGNISDNSTYLMLTPTLKDAGKPPYWEGAYNNQIIGAPAPTYPPSSGYTADPNSYAKLLPKPDNPFTVTLGRPDYQLQGGPGKTQHRVSDVLVSVPPSALYPSSYFVWPLWAKDQVTLALTDAEITALTPLQTAQMGPGLIRAFDGTQWLRDQDITLQAKVATGLTSPYIHFDSNLSSTLVTSGGLWLPAFAEVNTVAATGFSGFVPYPDQPPLGRGAQSVAGTQVSVPANLWNFSIPSSDPRVFSVSTLGFFFTVTPAAPSTQQPLYCARLAIDAGTAIPSNWYTLIRPFAFEVHDITLQRGSVTILNNVIDPTKGETVRLSYTLADAGATTITVFTLDGDVVRRLDMGTKAAGEYSISWDGTNLAGLPVARGVYFIRVVAPGVDEIRKVMVIRR